MSPSIVRSIRCLLVWLCATTLLLCCVSLTSTVVSEVRAEGFADQSFETLLVWLCSFAAATCFAWLWLTTSFVILSAARGSVLEELMARPPGCPELVRRVVFIACGVAVVGSMAVPASADPQAVDGRAQSVPQSLSGLPLPERAIAAPSITHPPELRVVPVVSPLANSPQVRVRAGDTLWGIAAATLGPRAPIDAISDRWQEIYVLNRAVIGPDPDLIIPGQQLLLGHSGEDQQ